MRHAISAAGLALLCALAACVAHGQVAGKTAQQMQEQRQGDPQAQEEQAGKAALLPERKPDEQTVKGQPQGKPGTPVQKGTKKPVPRRAVRAIIGSMPAPAAPPAYGPVLNPALPQSPLPAPAGPQVPLSAPATGGLPAPAPINQCIGDQCTDSSGRRYQINGNAGTDSNGRLCNRSGNTVQCF